jgi:hypothetical protein
MARFHERNLMDYQAFATMALSVALFGLWGEGNVNLTVSIERSSSRGTK